MKRAKNGHILLVGPSRQRPAVYEQITDQTQPLYSLYILWIILILLAGTWSIHHLSLVRHSLTTMIL
jgi:hypothetical protein